MARALPPDARPGHAPPEPVVSIWHGLVSTAAIPTAVAAAIALTAYRAGSLTRSGAAAATLVGALALMAGRSWGAFLVAWFVIASVASRIGRGSKQARTGDVVEKGGARDAMQVVANGGVFAAAAVVALWRPESNAAAALAAAGALVAAGADTLATETGTLWRGAPFSLRHWTRVVAGTSGAVSLVGSLGMLGGALSLAVVAALTGLIPSDAVLRLAVAGVAGAVGDTLIGAWWQARRWCPSCERETEQTVHRCGTPTRPCGGVAPLTNDAVNALCTLIGAAAAIA